MAGLARGRRLGPMESGHRARGRRPSPRLRMLGSKQAVKVLFDEIAPRYADRPGGYTRIMRLAKPRLGDAGIRAILEFVGSTTAFATALPSPLSKPRPPRPMPLPEATRTNGRRPRRKAPRRSKSTGRRPPVGRAWQPSFRPEGDPAGVRFHRAHAVPVRRHGWPGGRVGAYRHVAGGGRLLPGPHGGRARHLRHHDADAVCRRPDPDRAARPARGIQRLYDASGREMLYILSFYLPRYLDLPLPEKLIRLPTSCGTSAPVSTATCGGSTAVAGSIAARRNATMPNRSDWWISGWREGRRIPFTVPGE